MEARYQTDLYASYLLIPIEGKADEKKYSYKMLERNRIKGVLGCKKRIEDGKSYLYYDITRKKNLLQEYKDRELKFIEMTELFQNLVFILEAVREYLLTEKMALLEPEFIYLDIETKEIFITMLPWEREDPYPFRKLAEFFLEKIDLLDKNGISAAYHFYRSQVQPRFCLSQFLPLLEKESILSRQKEGKEIEQEQAIEMGSYGVSSMEREEGKENEEENRYLLEETKETKGWIYSILLSFLLLGLSFLSVLDKNQRMSCIGLSITLFLLGVGYRVWKLLKKTQEKEKEFIGKESSYRNFLKANFFRRKEA